MRSRLPGDCGEAHYERAEGANKGMTATADRIDLALDKALAERSLHEFFRQSWRITTPGSEALRRLAPGGHSRAPGSRCRR